MTVAFVEKKGAFILIAGYESVSAVCSFTSDAHFPDEFILFFSSPAAF